ncbi:hypothetical protein BURCENBC7_AP7329 [Burkholderia cenocepacia BC7]|nr:hypothetical protein BURCENBC7_AP7329 [Burkholderia cenocepacia BC7]
MPAARFQTSSRRRIVLARPILAQMRAARNEITMKGYL